MTQSQTPLTIVYTKDVFILDKQELEEKGHVLLDWELFMDIRVKPHVDCFIGKHCMNHEGELDIKTINLWTKFRRAQIKAEKKQAKEEVKEAKKSKQITMQGLHP